MWTYSPIDVNASVLGIDIEGFASETFINIEPDSPTFTYKRAMDGSSMAIINKFAAYNVKFTLQQSSTANTWLHLLYNLFKTYGIEFAMPILIRDSSGTTSFFAKDCWFDKEPTVSFGTTLGNIEWSIRCNSGSYSIGGNGKAGNAADIIQAVTQALEVSKTLGIDLSSFSHALGSIAKLSPQSIIKSFI